MPTVYHVFRWGRECGAGCRNGDGGGWQLGVGCWMHGDGGQCPAVPTVYHVLWWGRGRAG